ncbi:MAG: endo alpha-1,4 polygalactosaminidase [Myxococcales bacterium]|nr:endo alpha-1,4 polygalactosaminidase [Myxococcales bacterium]
MVQLIALSLLGCSESQTCDEGLVRSGEDCMPYTAGAPGSATDVAPVPNGLTWQWQITEDVDTSHDVQLYDVDLFQLTPQVEQTLHDDGRIVICYFSAGSFEPWTDDADQFPDEAIGRPLDGWPDERWLDHTNPTVRALMQDRLDLAVARGCDGVEPDNITAYNNNSGFGLNATEQLQYSRFLADEAHVRGLSVAMKNDVDHVEELIDWFDFTVNEECADFDECETLAPFVQADKAVLHTEYVDDWADAPARASEVCGVEPGLSTIIKGWDLGPEWLACP